MTRVSIVRTVVAATLLAALTACGDQVSDPGRRADPAASWQTHRLAGESGPDQPVLMAAAGDDVLVLVTSERGVVQPHLSRDGGAFEAGTPLATRTRSLMLVSPVRLADGDWFTLGSGFGGVSAVALRSADGLRWRATPVRGLTAPADFSALVATHGGAVVVGTLRRAEDPSMGGFQAQAWTTTDGLSLQPVELPGVPAHRGYDTESAAVTLTEVGGGALLATGRVGRRAAVWRSTDAGAGWTKVDDPTSARPYQISQVVTDGDRVVAAPGPDGDQILTSSDGGRTWQESDALPVDEDGEEWTPLWQAGRLSITTRSAQAEGYNWSAPEVCYADLTVCGAGPRPRLVVSPDGERWRAVQSPDVTSISQVVGTDDGRIVLVRSDGRGVVADVWPAGVSLVDAPDLVEPPAATITTLGEGDDPRVGVRYAQPLFTHCGISRIMFGDRWWVRTDDGPDYETGAGDEVPDGWPVPEGGGSVYGYATLGADDVLTYTDERGTVLATYEPTAEAFFCD